MKTFILAFLFFSNSSFSQEELPKELSYKSLNKNIKILLKETRSQWKSCEIEKPKYKDLINFLLQFKLKEEFYKSEISKTSEDFPEELTKKVKHEPTIQGFYTCILNQEIKTRIDNILKNNAFDLYLKEHQGLSPEESLELKKFLKFLSSFNN